MKDKYSRTFNVMIVQNMREHRMMVNDVDQTYAILTK